MWKTTQWGKQHNWHPCVQSEGWRLVPAEEPGVCVFKARSRKLQPGASIRTKDGTILDQSQSHWVEFYCTWSVYKYQNVTFKLIEDYDAIEECLWLLLQSKGSLMSLAWQLKHTYMMEVHCFFLGFRVLTEILQSVCVFIFNPPPGISISLFCKVCNVLTSVSHSCTSNASVPPRGRRFVALLHFDPAWLFLAFLFIRDTSLPPHAPKAWQVFTHD